LKVQVNLELKADPNDEEDLKDRLFSALQESMEEDELNFTYECEEDEEMDLE